MRESLVGKYYSNRIHLHTRLLRFQRLDDLYIRPGAFVLYLGAASGTSVSHVSDIVGPEGLVYASSSLLGHISI